MFGIVKGTKQTIGGRLTAGLAVMTLAFGMTFLAWSAAQETDTQATVPPLQLLVAQSPELGAYLTSSGGQAIYIFLDDTYEISNCDLECATAWPPVVVEAGADLAEVGLGIDADLLSTIALADGTEQLVYNGWPLYYYTADAAGSTFGHGVGGVWYLVTPEGTGVGIEAGALGGAAAPQ